MSPPALASTRRVASIDVLRGSVLVVMALDHVRDYFGAANINPTDPATTSVALFFTRWITHFCAPVFFLLMGTGAYLSLCAKGKEGASAFLLKRGLWLIVLETVLLRCLGWQFNFDFRVTIFFVLWALGWSLITLAILVRWPPMVSAVFGLTLILGHNLLDGVNPASFGAARPLWIVLHQPGLLLAGPKHFILLAYPLIPWIGVTAAGYALGQVFEWEAARRRAFLLRVGLGLTIGFVVLRWLNIYGDPVPWSAQRSSLFTLLSFLNTTKYPPSLLFLLMTLGPALLLLRLLDNGVPTWLRPTVVLGRVPLFYYALHVPLIHLVAVVICWFRYGDVHWMFESPTLDKYPITQPPGWPLPLPYIYAIWILVVVMLWPICRWYARLKERRRDWWLGYL
ncbi:MAG: DUF1624 domain-containing protein [Gemmatimonadaceae bacterium]